MLKNILVILLIFAGTQTYSQNNNSIVIGTTITIHSTILKEKREVLVYVPGAGNKGIKNMTRYPVIYLLDGYSFFHSLTGMVQYLSAIGKMPEMIVVAIVNTDRMRDLTPTQGTSWSNGEKDPVAFKLAGGGEKFTSFLQKELIPYIEAHYQTEPYRMFVGHSLGGLMAMNTLINHPALFNSYIAIDPTLWWDQEALLKKAAALLKENNYAGKSLFFASANTISVLKDTADGNTHFRANLKFRDLLQKNKSNNLVWKWKYYKEDNHPSVPLIAGYDALRSLFENYALSKELNDTSINADFIAAHYRKVSAMLGYKVLPSQSTVNVIGYNCLSDKHYDKAYLFFKMNIENYPENYNVYDSMGDYYLATGEKRKAMELLTKALTLKEHPDTRKKLESLKAELQH